MGANDPTPYIIVGLGNPGPKYALTRHNIGFMVVDLLAARWKAGAFPERVDGKFHAHILPCDVFGKRVILVKPQTFMNVSGKSVSAITQFYKINPASHLVVISDDLDLAPGLLRIRLRGSSGGHNGLKSIAETLGTEEFVRFRIGIGRSQQIPSDQYVLGRITKAEEETYQVAINKAADAVEVVMKENVQNAMNMFNQKNAEKDVT